MMHPPHAALSKQQPGAGTTDDDPQPQRLPCHDFSSDGEGPPLAEAGDHNNPFPEQEGSGAFQGEDDATLAAEMRRPSHAESERLDAQAAQIRESPMPYYYSGGVPPPPACEYEYDSHLPQPYAMPSSDGGLGESREEGGAAGTSFSPNPAHNQHTSHPRNPLTTGFNTPSMNAGYPPQEDALDYPPDHRHHQDVPEEARGPAMSGMMADQSYHQYPHQGIAYPPYMAHHHHHTTEQHYHQQQNHRYGSHGMPFVDMHAPHEGHMPYFQHQGSGGMGYNPYYHGLPPHVPLSHAAAAGMVDPSFAAPAASATSEAAKEPPKKKTKHRKVQKKHGKPKRPLSAYNLFFQDQRAKMLREIGRFGNHKEANEKYSGGGAVAPKEVEKQRKTGIGFAEMARSISACWKNIDAPTLSKYKKKAAEDMVRYRTEMEAFNRRREEHHQTPENREDETA